jgi:hypothetical protein
MQGSATHVLALIRLAEGWSWANVLGALVLGTVTLALIVLAFLVTGRR